ncbi:hypothetical protein MTR67_047906 [Solanum verrucosum]|uniref:Partial AB-hydrolase lipase domain-containing protein n=1 Tax=Solanum verrucosum TaxID=315347 RepID=A0AAF0V0K8_SOLVR|nr:hypothetical protein MTR67_047906 [Solanum verrucosum]
MITSLLTSAVVALQAHASRSLRGRRKWIILGHLPRLLCFSCSLSVISPPFHNSGESLKLQEVYALTSYNLLVSLAQSTSIMIYLSIGLTKTKDGFLLGLQRVSSRSTIVRGEMGLPVLLIHGLLMDLCPESYNDWTNLSSSISPNQSKKFLCQKFTISEYRVFTG